MSLTKATYSMINGAVINVLDYGAYNDGTNAAATATAIRSAATAAAYGTLYFPEGVYLIDSTIQFTTPMKVVGEYSNFANGVSRGSVIKAAPSFTGSYVIDCYGFYQGELEHLTIDINGNTSKSALALTSNNIAGQRTVSNRFTKLVIWDGSYPANPLTSNNIGVNINPTSISGVDNQVSEVAFYDCFLHEYLNVGVSQRGDNTLNIHWFNTQISAYTSAYSLYGGGDVSFYGCNIGISYLNATFSRTPRACINLYQAQGTIEPTKSAIPYIVSLFGCYAEPANTTYFIAFDSTSSLPFGEADRTSIVVEAFDGTWSFDRKFLGSGSDLGYDFIVSAIFNGGSYKGLITNLVDTGEFNNLNNRQTAVINMAVGNNLVGSGQNNVLYSLENTFLPTVYGTTSAGTATYVIQNGVYQNIGKLVVFNIEVQWSATTGTGNLRIGNLPFTSVNTFITTQYSCSVVGQVPITAGTQITAAVLAGEKNITILQIASSGTPAGVALPATGYLSISGSYFIG